jgi:hypothetical protein
MTDKEILEECKLAWVETTSWGWTHDEFMGLLGYLEPNEERTLKNGKVVWGSLVSYWFVDWKAFEHGWVCAAKHYGVKNET